MTQLVKTEPGSTLPSLIKSEPDLANTLSDDAISSLLKTLMTLTPAVKSNLIQSILSAGAGPDCNSDGGYNISSPLTSQPPVTMATTTPTKIIPALRMPIPSSSPVLVPTSMLGHRSVGNMISTSHNPYMSSPTLQMHNSHIVNVSSPSNQSLSTSLPQLIPVTSDFSSLVAAPASTSVMNSGNHTSGNHGNYTSVYSDYRTTPVCTSQISMVSDILNNNSFITTNSSQQLQNSPIDRSSTDSEELNMQARKLADQLAAVRSRLLLSSFETSGTNNQYLSQLVKLEQLIHVLQEAVAQRQVRAVQPSIILGGARCAEEQTGNFNMYQSGYDGVGVKRKTSPKALPKSGKKIKHSGGSHGIQLWQFILELLGDREQRPVLAWTGNGLEFRIINSVELARLWGIRKRNPIMNFDKLSRALRYYYEKNIIKHNPMHRLVYSFCNNPDDVVYNALLNRALSTCPIDPEMAKQQVGTSPYQWQDNLNKVPGSIKVTLQAVRNKMNGMVEEEKFPLSVNNS